MADRAYLGYIDLVELKKVPQIKRYLVTKFESDFMKWQYGSLASAYTANDTDLADSWWTELVLEQEEYDYGSNYNVSNGRYTCPVAGVYLMTWSVFYTVADSSQTLVTAYSGIGINALSGGTLYGSSSFYGSAMYNWLSSGSAMKALSKDDTLSLYAYASSSGASEARVVGDTNTRMSIALISTT
jgi:hypothetical protein